MHSIKPGRGPSFMGGIAAIAMAVIVGAMASTASSWGAPSIFVLVPGVMVVLCVASAIYNFANAAGRNRMSTLDITTGDEEPDPIAQALGYTDRSDSEQTRRRAQSFREERSTSAEPGGTDTLQYDAPEPSASRTTETAGASSADPPRQYPGAFCPFCGTKVEQAYDYCPNCGKDI